MLDEKNIKYDLDSWNLDFLRLKGPLKDNGEVIKLMNVPNPDAIRSMYFTPQGNLIMLSAERDGIHIVDHASRRKLLRPSDADSKKFLASDLFVSGDLAYILIPETNRILKAAIIDTGGSGDFLDILEYIQVPGKIINNDTRLAVLKRQGEEETTYFLAPTNTGGAAVISSSNPGEPKFLPLTFNAKEPCSTQLSLCVDWRANSILIADAVRHRIGELHLSTGRFTNLCGIGKPGSCKEAEVAVKARLNGPKAIALLRPRDLIRLELLSRESVDLINRDPSQVLPRTILFSEPQNQAIRRLVELPHSPNLMEYSGFRGIYTLIGDTRPRARKFILAKAQERKRGSLCIPINACLIAISEYGEMAVLTSQIILFKPATTMNNEVLIRTAQRSGSYPT